MADFVSKRRVKVTQLVPDRKINGLFGAVFEGLIIRPPVEFVEGVEPKVGDEYEVEIHFTRLPRGSEPV